MGSSTTTTTVTREMPGIGGRENAMRDLMAQMAQSGMGEMGNLSDLAQGNLTLSAEDEALIRRIQELTMEQARNQVKGNYDFASNLVEGRALDRGIAGSTMEAVDQALLGREMQTALDTTATQGQITSAQQLQEAALNKGKMKLSANQLLLQKILGSAQPLADMELQERINQTSSTQKTKTPVDMGQMAGLGTRALAAYFSGGTSEVAAAAGGGGGGGGASSGAPANAAWNQGMQQSIQSY